MAGIGNCKRLDGGMAGGDVKDRERKEKLIPIDVLELQRKEKRRMPENRDILDHDKVFEMTQQPEKEEGEKGIMHQQTMMVLSEPCREFFQGKRSSSIIRGRKDTLLNIWMQ